MKCNVGPRERRARAGLMALGAFGALLPLPRWLRSAMLLLSAAELFTVATGYCPVNDAMGRDTCQG